MTVRPRDEEGVIAVVFAICAAMLLSVAALGVDLGNAFARERMTQGQADYAALAAGPDLPVASTTPVATDAAVRDVAQYLLANAVPDDSGSPLPDLGTLAVDLVSTDPATMARYGHVYYGSFVNGALVPSKDQVTVVTPGAQVDFGLARVMGFNDTHVASRATVQVFSPVLNNTLPLYAAQDCSFGPQTLAQPSNGLAASAINLANGTDTNGAVLTGLTALPATAPAAVASPYSATTSLTITGKGFTGATAVGFFESGASATGPAPVVVSLTTPNSDGTIPVVAAAAITGVELPQSPQLAQDTWYVRVKINGQWSPVSLGNGQTTTNALPLIVGSPALTCQQGSSSGNFGSLDLYNPDWSSGGQTDNIAYNIARNLKHTLSIFKNPAADWTCGSTTPGAVLWETHVGTDGTNCVATQTGNVAADAAYEGFIGGLGQGTIPGRLQNIAPGTGCASDGKPATAYFNNIRINDDTLSCFLTNDSTTLGAVTSSSYTGPTVFSPGIYNSPRFVFVPVLGRTPTNGTSTYEIVGFRAGFITDQVASATRTTPEALCTVAACNGFTMSSNGKALNSLQVVFINDAALPPLPDLPDVATYSGSGQRVFRLID